jgi:chromate reductase
VLGAGGGMGTIRAQLALRQISLFLDVAIMLKPEVAIRRWNADFSETTFNAAGDLIDPKVQGQVEAHFAALKTWVSVFKLGKEAVAAAEKA